MVDIKKALETLNERYLRKSVEYIAMDLNLNLNLESKSVYSSLTKILVKEVLNTAAAAQLYTTYQVKSVRLDYTNTPKESLSFSAFKYEVIAKETWEDSSLKMRLGQPFLFFFYQEYRGKLVFKKLLFWHLPKEDINEAKKAWLKTKKLVLTGNIVKELKNKRRKTNFPKSKDNHVVHVRPHATNSDDTYPLPIRDNITKVSDYTKHSFWLNKDYIRDTIFKGDD